MRVSRFSSLAATLVGGIFLLVSPALAATSTRTDAEVGRKPGQVCAVSARKVEDGKESFHRVCEDAKASTPPSASVSSAKPRASDRKDCVVIDRKMVAGREAVRRVCP